ncbi:hypothetical protein [Actinomadura formosensis]|uniref:hypothetical protein n=1 Tax=Actinomadura formosensis TaxID=60706 RepID=UPI000835BEF1|nr:hypothetical protein [Actinomadura formosensis]
MQLSPLEGAADGDPAERAVRQFGHDPRVYGWHLTDEPNTGDRSGVDTELVLTRIVGDGRML